MTTQQSLANKVRTLVNKPLTLWELARLIGPRRGYGDENSVYEKIQYWIHRGFYGVRLHAWKATGTQMTTLKHYLEFRQKVARQRKKSVTKLLQRIQTLRVDEMDKVSLPFTKNRLADVFARMEEC